MLLKKAFLKKLVLCLIIILALVLAPMIYLGRFWSNIFISTADTSSVHVQSSQALDERFKEQKPFSILLLGYGGGTHEGAYLTDSIMDIMIDPSHKKITLISIPRDIWVGFPESFGVGDHWKINAAYVVGINDKDFTNKLHEYQGTVGGINLTKYAVSEITGQPVDRVVLVDFDGFKKGVDLLGGIDVTIEKTFDDYAYPIDGKEMDPCGKSPEELDSLKGMEIPNPEEVFPCRYEHLHFSKGIAHLDGTAALKLARSRHSAEDGTDFGRSARQRNIFAAIKQKVLTPAFLPKVFPMLSLLSNHIKTDISLSEIQTLISQTSSLEGSVIQNLALTNDNFLQDSSNDTAGYILVPKDGIDSWDNVHSWISAKLSE